MRYKALFRMMCKALGVYLMGWAIVGTVATVTGAIAMAMMFSGLRGTLGRNPWWSLIGLVAQLAMFLVGLYLFMGARRVVDWAVPGNRVYCAACGCDLSKASGDACPECGASR